MPYLPFPESPPVVRMGDYSPLKGYVHADKHREWSYGRDEGPPGRLAGRGGADAARGPAARRRARGLDGLWVDTYGFQNPDAEVLKAAGGLTGQQPMVSED